MKTQRRRRKEYKTDYLNRINLLKGEKPRIVFRKTNYYIISQYAVSKNAQDKIEFGITSKDLLKYGWSEKSMGSLKSLTASYLTGLLMGKMIKNKKLKDPVIDFGMIRMIHKTKPYAFIKGVIDSGLNIECKKEAFPEEDRIKGKHLKNKIQFDEIKSKILK